jgi:hypothetical protein
MKLAGMKPKAMLKTAEAKNACTVAPAYACCTVSGKGEFLVVSLKLALLAAKRIIAYLLLFYLVHLVVESGPQFRTNCVVQMDVFHLVICTIYQSEVES